MSPSRPAHELNTTAEVPRELWPKILVASTIEVFSMMVRVDLQPAHPSVPIIGEVTGVIGIAGAFRGIYSLRCSRNTAIKIASQMLAIPCDQAAEHHQDAVGEICNINAGDFKAKIGYGAKCMLTVPTIIEGTDYRVVRPVVGKDSIQIPLQYEDEPIWVALEIRK